MKRNKKIKSKGLKNQKGIIKYWKIESEKGKKKKKKNKAK